MLRPGDTIGDYVLSEPIGEGGSAVVWSAQGPLGNTVALKILHAAVAEQPRSSGPSAAERFIAEAKLLQRIDHPGMVRVYDWVDNRDEGINAFAMEHLIGANLLDLSRSEVLELPSLLTSLAEVSNTLGDLHRHGVIHRDVKQSNIFVCTITTRENAPMTRLLDFGIAKQLHEDTELENTMHGFVVGTTHTLTPEVVQRAAGVDSTLTGAVDQWGVGVVLFKCLTGQFPFRGDDYPSLVENILNSPTPRPRLKPRFGYEAIPTPLDEILKRTLAKRPEDRYPDAYALSCAFNEARTALFGAEAAVDELERTAQVLWEGPAGPLDLAALPAHRGLEPVVDPGDAGDSTAMAAADKTALETYDVASDVALPSPAGNATADRTIVDRRAPSAADLAAVDYSGDEATHLDGVLPLPGASVNTVHESTAIDEIAEELARALSAVSQGPSPGPGRQPKLQTATEVTLHPSTGSHPTFTAASDSGPQTPQGEIARSGAASTGESTVVNPLHPIEDLPRTVPDPLGPDAASVRGDQGHEDAPTLKNPPEAPLSDETRRVPPPPWVIERQREVSTPPLPMSAPTPQTPEPTIDASKVAATNRILLILVIVLFGVCIALASWLAMSL